MFGPDPSAKEGGLSGRDLRVIGSKESESIGLAGAAATAVVDENEVEDVEEEEEEDEAARTEAIRMSGGAGSVAPGAV
jgi:hypothetical protein